MKYYYITYGPEALKGYPKALGFRKKYLTIEINNKFYSAWDHGITSQWEPRFIEDLKNNNYFDFKLHEIKKD